MLVGPSGSGKTVLLTNMILDKDIYKGCFSRVYIWSPSTEVDNTRKPVKDYIRDHIKPNDRDTYYFYAYDPAELEQVINIQKKLDYQNRNMNIYTKYSLLFGYRGRHKFYTNVSIITSVIHKRKTLYDVSSYANTGL